VWRSNLGLRGLTKLPIRFKAQADALQAKSEISAATN
jgi:hypothetical protein